MSTKPGATRPSSNRNDRLDEVVEYLMQSGTATAHQLSEVFGVSVMTIHRDLDELQRRGIARKFYGGVSVERTASYEIAAALRRRLSVGVKTRLGSHAVSLVQPGQTVMIDDSTTVATMVADLGAVEGIQVWTNYLPTLSLLTLDGQAQVHAIGGRYEPAHESFLGAVAVDTVRSIRVDTVFVSTSTADQTGLFHQEEDTIQLKRQMLASARRRVLLLDSSKIGRTSHFVVDDWANVDDLITDAAADAAFLDAVRARDVTVHVVAETEEDRRHP